MMRYIITEKGVGQLVGFWSGWRLNTTQTQILDVLNRRRKAGLSKGELACELGLYYMHSGELAVGMYQDMLFNLRRLLLRRYVRSEVTR